MHEENTVQPLTGIKVIEMGSLIAGPYAAALLAQFGAEVIKIEPPDKGDPLRKWRKLHDGTSLWWRTQSRNKKSITLDLKSVQGQNIARQLITTADVVIENFRPGTLEKWNLGWDQLSSLNPNLIMVRVSGYGQTGPYASKAGFAAVAECIGGLRYTTGYPDRPPVRTGVSLGDTLASLYGVIGALLALHYLKQPAGKGQFVDVALYESVFAIMESLIPEYAVGQHQRERSGSSLPGISPSNTYICKDQVYVAIAGNSDSVFKRLMTAMNRPDLADDERFASNHGRVEHNDFLDNVIAEWAALHTGEDLLAILDKASVPSGSIYTAADIMDDEHYQFREMIESHKLGDGTPISVPGIIPKLSATPGKTQWLGPELGAHNDEVLEHLGFNATARQRLQEEGVI